LAARLFDSPQKTRELFKENNISFVEYDIEKSERSLKEYKRLGGTGVPLIKINGKVIRGYNQKVILASLNSN
jgi:glutaredoxin